MHNLTLYHTATFKIVSVFNIVNRGLVITGQIVNGTVEAGNSISLNMQGELANYKIDSVEYVDHSGLNEYEIGLIFKSEGSDAQTHLESLIDHTIKVLSI